MTVPYAQKIASVAVYSKPSVETGNMVVFAQRLNGDGKKIGDPIPLTSNAQNSTAQSTLILANNGFEVTYTSTDPYDPGPFETDFLATVEVSPDGKVIGGTGIGAESFSQGASLDKIVALATGGYAYLATTQQTDGDVYNRTATLGYVGADGKSFVRPLVSYNTQYGPYPIFEYTQPILKTAANGAFDVKYTTFYGEVDPEYPPPLGVQTFEYIYSPAGVLATSIITDADGQTTYAQYNSSGKIYAELVRSGEGSTTAINFDVTTGKETSEHTSYVDGSHTDVDLMVKNKPYATQSASYDASGRLTSLSRAYSNGLPASTYVSRADGSSEAHNYDTAERETSRTLVAADGSKEVVNSSYLGANPTPSTIQDFIYAPGNRLLSVDTTNPDGTHTQVATSSGVTLASTASVADTFRAANTGGDTFVFAPGFGQDLITNFHAGASIGHDIADFTAFHVMLGSNQSQSDYLAQHLKQSGGDAVLTIAPNDVLTLKNTQIASLTTADVRI